jgi:hypothetical protein
VNRLGRLRELLTISTGITGTKSATDKTAGRKASVDPLSKPRGFPRKTHLLKASRKPSPNPATSTTATKKKKTVKSKTLKSTTADAASNQTPKLSPPQPVKPKKPKAASKSTKSPKSKAKSITSRSRSSSPTAKRSVKSVRIQLPPKPTISSKRPSTRKTDVRRIRRRRLPKPILVIGGTDSEAIYERTENALFDEYGQTDPFVEEEDKIEYCSTAEGPDVRVKPPEFVTEGISTHDNASLQTDPVPSVRIRMDDIAVQSAPIPPAMIEKQVQVELEEEDSTSTFSSSSSSDSPRGVRAAAERFKKVIEPVQLERVSIPALEASDEEFSSTSDDVDFMVSD